MILGYTVNEEDRLQATFWPVAKDGPEMDFPEGFDFEHMADWKIEDGSLVHDPKAWPDVEEQASEADDEAAMLVDHEYRLTLLELGI